MAYKLLITEKAENDLDAILAYIINDLSTVQAAVRPTNEIEERYQLLLEAPKLYGECQQPLLQQRHYRKVVIGSYLMIYRVSDEQGVIYVERFFSELQDYADRL